MTCSMVLQGTLVSDIGQQFNRVCLLPDLKTATTLPFQSDGKMPVESDCENSKVRYTADTCLIFF